MKTISPPGVFPAFSTSLGLLGRLASWISYQIPTLLSEVATNGPLGPCPKPVQ